MFLEGDPTKPWPSLPAASSHPHEAALLGTDHAGLFKGPQTPRLSAQLSLVLLYPLVPAEAATVACIVDFELGGSHGVSSMATTPDLFRDRGRYLRARHGTANLFVPSPSLSSPPVAGIDLAPQLHGVGNGDAATASEKTPVGTGPTGQ